MVPTRALASTLTFALVITCAARADAQSTTPCHPVSPTARVVITNTDGTKSRASLLCLTEEDVLVAGSGGISRQPLAGIARIATQADPVWDGAAKGAAVPLIIWAVLCRECSADPMLRVTATYALIGMTFDALHSHRHTIYTGAKPAATVSWRLRF